MGDMFSGGIVGIRRHAASVALAGTGLVVLADFLFYGHPLGWTAGLFGAVLIVLLVMRYRTLTLRRGGWLAGLGLGLALLCVDEPGPLRVGLGLLGVLGLAQIGRGGVPVGALARLRHVVLGAVRLPAQFLFDMHVCARWRRGHALRRPLERTLVRWTLPVLLTAVFLGLFWIANPIVARWMQRLGTALRDGLQHVFADIHPWRVLLWAIVAVLAWGLLRTRPGRARRGRSVARADEIATRWRWGRASSLFRCLLLFNLLFAVQTILDIAYLWGGATLPEGLTYAAYARRGAFPLVGTALLAAIFVLVSFRPGVEGDAMRWPRRLVCVWIAQNIFLMVSAARRLDLYVEAYSLTRLRLAAAVWMVLVAFGLATIVWRILRGRTNDWLLGVNLVATVAVLYGGCLVDVDAFIARTNVARCCEAGGAGAPIDFDYLRRLGPESIPALERLAAATDDPATAQYARTVTGELEEGLRQSLAGWRGWTWRRHRLATREINRGSAGSVRAAGTP